MLVQAAYPPGEVEFHEVIRRRFMCRSFQDRDVPEQKIEAILDAARRFPSAGHTQPQEFVVVRDASVKHDLARAALDQMFLADAPVLIAVVSDTDRSAARYGRRGVEFYSILDGGFASMIVLLAAVDQGLGAAFVAAFDDDAVGAVLHLPTHVRPIGLIGVGYCAEAPGRHRRRPRQEIIHLDRYSG
ncbi:MAG TPA: nitroreductase family protein [Actinomycetota bacterium]|nr:nitroreductase family protein [Actinomycetota bacterium]